ncbi:MAG: proton-conducting transporter membrane subunit [Chloroflexaceae bacterium]
MHDRQAGWLERALLPLLTALAALSAAMLVAQALNPQPQTLAGLTLDRLSATIGLLVAVVGVVVYRFALRYLDGEPRQRSFLRWLAFTVLAAYTFVFATHLLVLFGAWLLTSIGLHQLLTYYRDRYEAIPPARKKFLISRLGDVALIAAIAIIFWQWGTLDLNVFLARLSDPVAWSPALDVVAILVVTGALTKSAQFPFHSWLPETMEAPTPVSALMHAGIINGGGVLLLHFAPLIVQSPLALLNLVVVGTLTATLGMLAMWAQTNVKRTLAWSTVGQMGFMMVQIGLAAFPAAILHLVGHGCYKAWSFLRTGDVPRRAAPAPGLAPGQAVLLAVTGALAAVPALALASVITGFDPFQSPGKLALSTILALAIGQFWVASFQAPRAPSSGPLAPTLVSIAGTLVAAVLAFGLYEGAAQFFAPVFGELAVPTGPLAWIAAIIPVAVFLILGIVYGLLPALGRTAAGRAFYVHALHGFYLGAIADRLVERVWGGSPLPDARQA